MSIVKEPCIILQKRPTDTWMLKRGEDKAEKQAEKERLAAEEKARMRARGGTGASSRVTTAGAVKEPANSLESPIEEACRQDGNEDGIASGSAQ